MTRVQNLEQQAKRNFRLVVRDLTAIREITRAKEGLLVTVSRFLEEEGVVIQPNLQPRLDSRLKQAISRDALVHGQLVQAEGGSFSAEEAAKELNMSKVAILKRHEKGRLVAWQEEKQRAKRFPKWQFENGRVLPGLEVVLEKLNTGGRLDDFGKLLFFLSKSAFLAEKRPLDLLRDGESDKVLQAAQGYVE